MLQGVCLYSKGAAYTPRESVYPPGSLFMLRGSLFILRGSPFILRVSLFVLQGSPFILQGSPIQVCHTGVLSVLVGKLSSQGLWDAEVKHPGNPYALQSALLISRGPPSDTPFLGSHSKPTICASFAQPMMRPPRTRGWPRHVNPVWGGTLCDATRMRRRP